MSETPKTKSGWRWIRRILIGLAVLATLVAALYTEEDWRGKRAWENFKREYEAKGEKFDWHAFVPPSVPNDENFFTAPVFTNILKNELVMSPYGNDGGPEFPPLKDTHADETGYLGAEGRTRIVDLKIWQAYYRNPTNLHAVVDEVMTNGEFVEQTNYFNHVADNFPIAPQPQTPAKDVLLALSKYDSAIEQLREASKRPYANIPLNYEDGFEAAGTLFPYLADLKRCVQTLQLRVDAELADGQSEKALEDIKLSLYLNHSLRNSPFLISSLVRIAIVAINLQPIWQGLKEHKWSDEQLATLDSELAKMDFLADYEFAMRGERNFAIASFEDQRRSGKMIYSVENGMATNNMALMPNSFFYQNEFEFARMNQEWVLPIVDTNSRTVSPELWQLLKSNVAAESKHYSLYKVQALAVMPAVGASARKFSAVQSSIDLARVACALERYRLAHGEYPETLDALAPQFIAQVPHDIIGGQSLHYKRTDDGKFLLYSVGWNEKDDGGEIAFRKSGYVVDPDNGDWVWKN